MLEKLDGLWLNQNHITAVIVYESTSANDPHYKIKFVMGPETMFGVSRFSTERECRLKLDEIMGGM